MIKHTLVYTDDIEVSEALEYHTFDQLNKLDKFTADEIVQMRTTYSKEGSSFKVHSHGYHNGIALDATGVDLDMYKSVDLAASKLESQMRKEKEKRTQIDRSTDLGLDEPTDTEE